MWNTWHRTGAFAARPWLLNFFDQIRFFPVSHDDLTEARAAFPHGGYPVKIEETTFRWADHKRRFALEAGSIATFKTTQQAAFDAERARWKTLGLDRFVVDDGPPVAAREVPVGLIGVESPIPGNLWKFLVAPGALVEAGQTVAIIESMKMEISVVAPASGWLRECRALPGRSVRAGDVIAVMEAAERG